MSLFNDDTHKWIGSRDKLPNGLSDSNCPLFNMTVPVANSWEAKKYRLLVIVQHVDSSELKSKALLSGQSGVVVSNVLRVAYDYATLFSDDIAKFSSWAISAINFNYFKSYHLDYTTYGHACAAASRRCKLLMEKLKPTHILILGDEVAHYILRGEEHQVHRRGHVRTYKGESFSALVTHTLDVSKSYLVSDTTSDDEDDEDADYADMSGDPSGESMGDRELAENANLLGFAFRCASSLFLSTDKDSLHHGIATSLSIADVTPNPKFVDTIRKIDKLFDYALTADVVAVDTECESLNRVANTLYTIQMSFDEHTGLIIPVDHKDTPFSSKELVYVKERARDFFYQRVSYDKNNPRYLITTNGKFDATILRQALGVPLIFWPQYDVQGGEFALDENIGRLSKIYSGNRFKPYALDSIAARYGNFFYHEATGFSKADRVNIKDVTLTDESFLAYTAMDTQLPFAIHNAQLNRASKEKYSQFRHFMLTQMSNNIHTFSEMEHRGVHLDVKHLLKMLQPDSPLKALVRDAENELYSTEAAKEANRILLKNQGINASKGLFGEVKKRAFDITKQEHQQVLFVDVLDLDPLSHGKNERKTKGKVGQSFVKLDKFFQAKYKGVQEVALFTKLQKVKKLISAYVEAFYRRISQSADGVVDGHLRPDFGYLKVVTGRGNSANPSLQQTPTRTKEAKYIKRAFAPPKGRFGIKFDYSAQEVRGAGLIARDPDLSERFAIARELKRRLYYLSVALDTMKEEIASRSLVLPDVSTVKPVKNPPEVIEEMQYHGGGYDVASFSDKELLRLYSLVSKLFSEIKVELKTKGDIHIQNVHFFFQKWVDKEDPLRDAIKAVAFGVLYGKGPTALGKDTQTQRINDLKKKIEVIESKLGGKP